MDIKQILKKYSTENKCYNYLKKLKWDNKITCPFCNAPQKRIVKLNSEKFRYHCYDCHKSFSVLTNTIFEDSKLPLQDWFTIIGLMTNAKLGISAKDIERNSGVTYKTAWYVAMRIRCGMIDQCNIELENIVEMDEAYVGGRPRHRKCKIKDQTIAASGIDVDKPKRGRGTCKTPIVGIVERKGKVVVKVIEKLNFKNLLSMLKEYVNIDNSTLITDEFRGYSKMDDIIEHFVIEHQKEYVRGAIHTNTIEGFWSIVKNSIKGNHIKVSKKYLPFYLLQSQYMYNHRNYEGNIFEKFLKEAVQVDKSELMNDYNLVKPAKELIYKHKCKKGKVA